MSSERYLGESTLKSDTARKLSITLREGSVTTDKIANKSVTAEKLSDDISFDVDALTPADVDRLLD